MWLFIFGFVVRTVQQWYNNGKMIKGIDETLGILKEKGGK